MSRSTGLLGQCILFWSLVIFTLATQASDVTLSEGWQFRWGDSPVSADGSPAWAQGQDPRGWQAINFPSNPPGRDGKRHAWFKTTLPSEGSWRDPVLYIYSVDLLLEAYLEGQRHYRFGEFDADGQGHFAGWPWHMIELPPDFAGQPMYFRVYSDYTDIGLWGEIKIMERAELFGYVLRHSAIDLGISMICLLLALLTGVFTTIQPGKRHQLAPIALFSLASGSMILAETQASQLLIDAPLMWNYLAAGGYFLLPVALGLLVEQWYRDTRLRLIRRIWQLHLAYWVIALGAASFGWISLAITYPVFDGLLLMSLVLMAAIILPRLKTLDDEQKAILATHGVFSLLLIADMAVAHGLLPWGRVPVSAGALVFSIVIVVISLFEYKRTQQEFKALNLRLEQEVAQRTGELQTLIRRLEVYSYTDPLTGLYNRRYFTDILEKASAQAMRHQSPLTLVMIDIDHFKRINDQYGHEAGDYVLVNIASQLKQHFREADVICRLGGEEFAILLYHTEAGGVQQRTDELLDILSDTLHVHQGTTMGPITVSCGIASFPQHVDDPQALLGLADKALYSAKLAGRARSHVYT